LTTAAGDLCRMSGRSVKVFFSQSLPSFSQGVLGMA